MWQIFMLVFFMIINEFAKKKTTRHYMKMVATPMARKSVAPSAYAGVGPGQLPSA
jgi:hypothetical protein